MILEYTTKILKFTPARKAGMWRGLIKEEGLRERGLGSFQVKCFTLKKKKKG